MVDPVSILVGLLEFLLNVVVGIVLDFLADFLWDLLRELLDGLLEVVDPIVLLAVTLLILGLAGTLVPMVPGPLVSLAGVLVYWVGTGFSEPTVGWIVVFGALGLSAMFVDYFGGVLSARVGGASATTTLAGVVVGIVLTVVVGPVGFLAGMVGTVFGMEYYRHENGERAAKSAAVTLGGMLGSAIAQVVLTGAILVLMVAFIIL